MLQTALFPNDKKTSPAQPDFRGPFKDKDGNVTPHDVAGWLKMKGGGEVDPKILARLSELGVYISLSVKPREPKGDTTASVDKRFDEIDKPF